jgi:hypothetical protein
MNFIALICIIVKSYYKINCSRKKNNWLSNINNAQDTAGKLDVLKLTVVREIIRFPRRTYSTYSTAKFVNIYCTELGGFCAGQ